MKDLALNENFSVFLDDRNDLAMVEGNDGFEQAVVVRLTDYMHENITGAAGSSRNIREKINLQVMRVARDMDSINEVASVEVEKSDSREDKYEVTVVYLGGDDFVFEVNS